MRQILIWAWLASIFLLQISVKSEDEQTPQVHHGISIDQILIYCGYIIIGLGILSLILTCLNKRCKQKKQEESIDDLKVAAALDEIKINNNNLPISFSSVELKGKTDFSTESNAVSSSSLTVLTSPVVNGLKFEDLLRSPAELIGRGRHGSVYKVACEAHGVTLVVKRIKDWTIPGDEFKQRMKRLDRVKHPNVLPVIAFYGSRQEKLLVYEYQKNGNLFKLIRANYGNNKESSSSRQYSSLDCWSIRLSVAAKIANALAFMHEELSDDKIPHGNLKSSNILFDENMEPCISEYGLMIEENNQDQYSPFKADVYAFGSILLELLTGRMVLDEGLDIASWVLAVVREEWTVEVFDRNLIREGASEERMVNLLQIAIKCVDKSPDARPSMKDVALGVNAVRDDDERSMDVVSNYSTTRSFKDL